MAMARMSSPPTLRWPTGRSRRGAAPVFARRGV